MDDAALAGRDVSGQCFEVMDADGHAAFTVPFLLAMDDEPPARRPLRRGAARRFGREIKKKPAKQAAIPYLRSPDRAEGAPK